MNKYFLISSLLFTLSFSATASQDDAILVLQLKGDSGSSISSLNKKLKAYGEKLLPTSIELNSKMTRNEITQIMNDLNRLVDKASRNESLDTSAYGDVINGKTTCFKGNNKKVSDIYAEMVDGLVSDQFTILATSTKNPDRVGILYDETDSGSAGTWINIWRCK